MRRLSIGVRLTLWYLVIFAVAQVVFAVGMWVLLRHNLYDMVDDDLESQVDDLKRFLEAQKKNASVAKLQEEVNESYAIEHYGDYLELYVESGDLIYRSAFLQAHPSTLGHREQVKSGVMQNRRIDGRPFRFIFEKLEGVNGHVYTVMMGAPSDDVVKTLSLFRLYLFMFAPLLLLVAAGGGYWLSRRALSPVDALVRTAREVGGTNLSGRLQKLDTGDELQRLSDTLNEMLNRIESAFNRVTQFTADASHELRTPVSLIRTEAEVALRRSRGEAEYKESLRNILLESERTTMLIEQLLSLARADSARESLHMQALDLRQMLNRVVDGWRHVAMIRNLQFSTSLSPQGSDSHDLFVMGEASALRRVVDILLDNAFKYTAAPGSVYLSVEEKGESAVITVQDSGMGIDEAHQSKIFERFYRVDESRSRAQGGAGLGLAIARWIVTQHRGSITVESCPGCGSLFRVKLPMIASPVQNRLPA